MNDRTTMARNKRVYTILALMVFLSNAPTISSFVPPLPLTASRFGPALFKRQQQTTEAPPKFRKKRPRATARLSALPDIAEMKAGEMRKELESYGISTKSFFEKSEFVQALEEARAQGKTPVAHGDTSSPRWGSSTSSQQQQSSASQQQQTSKGASPKQEQKTREERLTDEMQKAQSMKVSDLRETLRSMGIATRSFFEKSEFVKAYAEAIVDGKQPNGAGQEEDYDPTYRDVVMQKMDKRDPRLLQGTVIDVQLA